MPVIKIKISEKNCWQKKPCWQTKDNVNMAEWTISAPQQPAHTGIWSSTVRACSYRYYLMKNDAEWTISTPTTSPCIVKSDCSSWQLLVSSCLLWKTRRHWQTWKTLFWEKGFLAKMKIRIWKRKPKSKLPIIAEK